MGTTAPSPDRPPKEISDLVVQRLVEDDGAVYPRSRAQLPETLMDDFGEGEREGGWWEVRGGEVQAAVLLTYHQGIVG